MLQMRLSMDGGPNEMFQQNEQVSMNFVTIEALDQQIILFQ